MDNLMPRSVPAGANPLNVHDEQWERDLDAVRAPHMLRDLLREIDLAATLTSDPTAPDMSDPHQVRLSVLLEALRLLNVLPLDDGAIPEQVSVVRDAMQAIQRRATAENSMGLGRYTVATADLQDALHEPGDPVTLSLLRARHLAWEYAHGKTADEEPWSIGKLADRVGLTKARAQQLINKGKRSWREDGVGLPR